MVWGFGSPAAAHWTGVCFYTPACPPTLNLASPTGQACQKQHDARHYTAHWPVVHAAAVVRDRERRAQVVAP